MKKLLAYLRLMRFDKPIGIFLLLWPTTWALALAGHNHPPLKITLIFLAGVVIMRASGCIINDIADRNFDAHVERTRDRPLATGELNTYESLSLFGLMLCLALTLLLQLNQRTIYIGIIGALVTTLYPFCKRVTYLPQFVLGFAFSLSVPMVYTALDQPFHLSTGCLFMIALLWPIIYDTMYAMADREDDKKIGIKSTALLLDQYDKVALTLGQCLLFALFVFLGFLAHLSMPYFIGLLVVAGLMSYQLWLIRERESASCFKAFLNNHWLGLTVLLAIIAGQLSVVN